MHIYHNHKLLCYKGRQIYYLIIKKSFAREIYIQNVHIFVEIFVHPAQHWKSLLQTNLMELNAFIENIK